MNFFNVKINNMKLKQLISEIAQLEYAPSGIRTNTKQATSMEKSIINAVSKAFATSSDLQQKFNLNKEPPYDVEVRTVKPNFEITLNPEDGSKKFVGTYPMSQVAKYLNNPKGMANFLLQH